MSCLLYGIIVSRSGDRRSGHPPPALPPGVCGAPVRLLEESALGAAISWIEASDLTSNIAQLLSYARVVEALHADQAVVPMRYGCLFGGEGQVLDLLRIHREEYAGILHELDGCVEMGVRVLLPTESSRPRVPLGPEMEEASGRAYLTELAARYAREEEGARGLAAVAERLRGALGRLAEKTEGARGLRADRGCSSLYFLVKREAVESFRRTFRRIERAEPARLLLSGPWPPYNFVAPERGGNGHG